MKKVFLLAVAVVAISLVSCNQKGAAVDATSADSLQAPVEVVEEQAVLTDTLTNDSVVVDEVAVAQ